MISPFSLKDALVQFFKDLGNGLVAFAKDVQSDPLGIVVLLAFVTIVVVSFSLHTVIGTASLVVILFLIAEREREGE